MSVYMCYMNESMWTGMSKYTFVWHKEKYRGINTRQLTQIILLVGDDIWRRGQLEKQRSNFNKSEDAESENAEVRDNNKEIIFYILWIHKEPWRSLRNGCFEENFITHRRNIFVKWFRLPSPSPCKHTHIIQIIEKISKAVFGEQQKKKVLAIPGFKHSDCPGKGTVRRQEAEFCSWHHRHWAMWPSASHWHTLSFLIPKVKKFNQIMCKSPFSYKYVMILSLKSI